MSTLLSAEARDVRPPSPGQVSINTAEGSSYRQILRATSITGGAQVFNILIGLVRTKLVAVLLGPAGVGLMGVLQGVMSTAGAVAGVGLTGSGVRQIAAASGDERVLSNVRHALWRANLVLGLLGAAAVWFAREPIARLVAHDVSLSAEVGLTGIGVLLSLVAGSQTALMQGLRRIGDMARASMLGGLVSLFVGVPVLWMLGRDGVVWYILLGPLTSIVVAVWYTRCLPRPGPSPALVILKREWRSLIGLGATFMITGLSAGLTQLVMRSLVVRELGLDAAGHVQAASAISMQYLGLVLAAMGADYYPRLTQAIHDPERANRLVNDQLEVALLLAGSFCLGMIALAPWLIPLLYSGDFGPAVPLLQWQVLGDVLKVASWPLGFILLARGDAWTFLLAELSWAAVFLGGLYGLLPRLGLYAAGVAFLAAYIYYIMCVWVLAYHRQGFRLEGKGFRYIMFLFMGGITTMTISSYDPLWGGILGCAVAFGWGVNAARTLLLSDGVPDRVKHAISKTFYRQKY